MNQISQAMNQADMRNDSRPRKSPTLKTDRCLICHRKYTGAGQSKYCSKPCNERADRIRKEALVDALVGILLDHSDQLSHDSAFAVSKRTVRSMYIATKNNLMALGYAYDVIGKRWVLQPRLRG
jgi:hypothetical protein